MLRWNGWCLWDFRIQLGFQRIQKVNLFDEISRKESGITYIYEKVAPQELPYQGLPSLKQTKKKQKKTHVVRKRVFFLNFPCGFRPIFRGYASLRHPPEGLLASSEPSCETQGVERLLSTNAVYDRVLLTGPTMCLVSIYRQGQIQ